MQLSIIVPVYNVEKYLKRCLDSIQNQIYKDFECILVDDGSPDNCPAICDAYAEKDSRFRVIHKENGGLVSAWMRGVLESKSNYIGFVDSDDWIEPDMYSSMMSKVEQYNLDCCLCSFKYVFEDTGKIGTVDFGIEEGFYDENNIQTIYDGIMPKLLKRHFIAGARWIKVFQRELLLKMLESYKGDVLISEDTMLTHPALLECNKVYFIKKDFYNYYKNSSSIMGTYKPEYLNDWYKATSVYEPYRNKFSYDTAIEECKFDYLIRNVINFIVRSNISFLNKLKYLTEAQNDKRVRKVLKEVKNIKKRSYYNKIYFVLKFRIGFLYLLYLRIKNNIKNI